MKLKKIAQITKCKAFGDGEVEVYRLRDIEDAKEGDITIYFKRGNESLIKNSIASAFFSDEPLVGKNTIVPDRKGLFYSLKKLIEIFKLKEEFKKGIHPTAIIGENVRLGAKVSIGAYSVIGDDVEIGDNTIVYPMVVIYPGVRMGKNCKIHSGVVLRGGTIIENDVEIDANSVIASAGFERGFKKEHLNMKPMCGGVRIGEKVFIGALTHVAKSVINETVIEEGTKIDALVYIGHGVKIGKYCRIAGQSGFSGNVKIEDEVSIGGQCGLADEVKVGKKAFIASKSGVLKNVQEEAYVVGTPAIDVKLWKRIEATLRNLPKIWEKIKKL